MTTNDQEPDTRWYSRPMPIGCAVGAVALLIYVPTWSFPFVYDDPSIILRNPPVIVDGPWYTPWVAPYWPTTSPGDPLYRPVTIATLRWEFLLWESNPMGYRVTAGLLHAAVTMLVAWLASTVWRHSAAGWAAGLWFAVHPVHAEALGSVVGLSELLAALFVTLLLWRHLLFAQRCLVATVTHHMAVAILFYLALGSKEHALVAIVGVVGIDLAYRRRRATDSLRERLRRLSASHYLGLIVALALYLVQRWWVFGWQTRLNPDMVNPFDNPLIRAGLIEQLLTPPALLCKAIELCLLPLRLCPIWSLGAFDLPRLVVRWDVLTGTGLAVGLVVICAIGLRRRWEPGWLVPCLAASLILPCHFVPAANWLFAERWLYLPTVFLAAAASGAAAIRPRLAIPIIIGIAALLTPVTLRYQQAWRSNDAIFSTTLERHPRCYHALVGTASSHKQRGALDEIPELIDRLLDAYPESPRSWYYHALRLADQDRPADTLEAIRQFVRLNGWAPLTGEMSRLRERERLRLEQVEGTSDQQNDSSAGTEALE